jgi:hypothetical protein
MFYVIIYISAVITVLSVIGFIYQLSQLNVKNSVINSLTSDTSGEFSKYPNIWKPVYHKEIEREKKINELLGE